MILMKERVGKLLEGLKEIIYAERYKVTEYRMLQVEERFKQEENLDTSDWTIMDTKDVWGGNREFFYFETVITVPEVCAGKTLVYELRTGKEGAWDAINPQFLAYVNGVVKQGLDVNHREILLTTEAKAGETFRILLSAYTGDNNFSLHLDSEFKVLIPEVEKYYYDLYLPYETARLLEKESDEHITIIQCLNDSLNLLDLRKVYSKEFFDSLKAAQEYITKEFYQKRCGNSQHTICCVGHTHIDVAWLWTLKTTEDKAVRSFSTVLEYMRQYPEYKFMSSQPQLYQYVKKNAPQVYEEIKKRVAEGRWETEGGMFVEADCNIASGEALVRQFLHGTRFFEEEFGKRNEILWLPDVFGYSTALPQIMKKCGICYFMTTKISWNEFDKMPCDTFMWEGIDGTQILTHFSPSRDFGMGAKEGSAETEHFTTYNAMLNPSQVKGSWQRYSQKYLNDEVLMSYGWGDGGGGPTKEMLENQRRMEQGIPGCPNTKQSHALEFFQQLEKDVAGSKYLPKWVGELYLEYHRGTYTSMARNKRYNRKSEFAYQNLEFYRTLAEKLLGMEYPKQRLQEAWEVILRNQFHDILPGSSIKEVYEDSKIEYEAILLLSEKLTMEALEALAEEVSGEQGDIVIFNPNSVSVKAPVLVPINEHGDNLVLYDGANEYPLQRTNEGMLAVVSKMPVKGYWTMKLKVSDVKAPVMTISTSQIDTPFFQITLNEKGHFISIYDKKCQREIIPKGQCANVIMTYEDKPHNFDAWDINNYYTEKSWPLDAVSAIEVIENGPVRGCIKIERPYLESTITQYLYFYPDLYRIDIRNEIDWRESQILVRDYLPVDIHTNEATYEIQYGNVKRPTHYNTSWDFAKFEVCAHKWLDVSEDGYGISILNDCKYGYNVHDGVIGLSMLKSAIYPNPDADKEHHTFWYSICPHEGDFREGDTVAKAYVFNNPYKAVVKKKEASKLQGNFSCLSVDTDHVVVEVVKQEENGSDTIIRLYECNNRRGKVTLDFAFAVDRITECNLLEKEDILLEHDGHKVMFEIKPYEIKTFKVRFQA
ncbi:MAG: alpha-mannosidase [Clostridiales bacterium]|nr:alpha-mannosidase [Clostridiales bacterium]